MQNACGRARAHAALPFAAPLRFGAPACARYRFEHKNDVRGTTWHGIPQTTHPRTHKSKKHIPAMPERKRSQKQSIPQKLFKMAFWISLVFMVFLRGQNAAAAGTMGFRAPVLRELAGTPGEQSDWPDFRERPD